MNFDQNDVQSLALVMWKEARGEGVTGMQAIANVICNRVGYPGFATNLHSCIYGKNQFTSMSVPTDPEFNLMPAQDDATFSFAVTIANSILTGSSTDLTNGAHYYANLKTATSGWFFNHVISDTTNHPQTAVIGHHTFFK